MARHWTPKRFISQRRWRIIISAALCLTLVLISFFIGVHKSVALTVDGKTRTVHTWALSVDSLLREQGVSTHSHDFVESSSGNRLENNSRVIVRTAYEATITIDGQEVGFWTYVKSADQLLALFRQNEENAVKVTINVKNIYNKLTGGFVINSQGPVTVIADNKKHIAKDGKQPAAGILDSLGLTLGKNDRVTVEQDHNTTILRITRISYEQAQRNVSIPYTSRTVEDNSLEKGKTVVEQEGVEGVKIQYVKNTLADGTVESSEVTKEVVTRDAQEEIIRVGTKEAQPAQAPEKNEEKSESDSENKSSGQTEKKDSDQDKNSSRDDKSDKDSSQSDSSKDGKDDKTNSESEEHKQDDSMASQKQQEQYKQQDELKKQGDAEKVQKEKEKEEQARKKKEEEQKKAAQKKQSAQKSNTKTATKTTEKSSTKTPTKTSTAQQTKTGLWHPTPAQAKIYARAAAAQYGWTGANWSALEWLWNRESSWLWYAENSSSGAYGIPQSLPGNKMAVYGANWRDDASIQINWGLNYIRQRYGSPLKAQAHSKSTGWY